jgi:RNA polymerase sigma-70 factor (ECF subfamily)
VGDRFSEQMLGMIPRLRVQAVALTRDRGAAEDLVQDALVSALAARDSFEPGTSMRAWMHTILRNRFYTLLRRRRETVHIDDAPPSFLALRDGQEDRLVLKELDRALARLPPRMREALVMVVVLGMSYEAVAAAAGTTVNTAKTRVFRARQRLWAMLMGEVRQEAPIPPRSRRAPGRGATSLAGSHA